MVNVESVIGKTYTADKTERFNGSRVFGYDFFISFKLGRPPIGAQSYASDLARRLRELDYTVFFSEEEAPPGAKLDTTLVKALHKSRILLVIANEGALLQSHWIRREIEEFRRKNPKRPVIQINVDHAIEEYGAQANASEWLGHDGRIWLDETLKAVVEGVPSPEVLKRLEFAPRFIRSNTRFRWLVATVVSMLFGLAVLASYTAWDANRKFRDATALRLVAEGGSMTSGLRQGGTIKGLFKVLAGHRLSRSANTDEALQTEYLKFIRLVYLGDNGSPINSLAFSRDGRRIVSGSTDKTLRLWPVFEGWADELCKKLGRNMSHKEWREWVSPYIDYIEQCPGLTVPPDESEKQVHTLTNQESS